MVKFSSHQCSYPILAGLMISELKRKFQYIAVYIPIVLFNNNYLVLSSSQQGQPVYVLNIPIIYLLNGLPPKQKPKVCRALSDPSHEIRIPFRTVRNIYPHTIPLLN